MTTFSVASSPGAIAARQIISRQAGDGAGDLGKRDARAAAAFEPDETAVDFERLRAGFEQMAGDDEHLVADLARGGMRRGARHHRLPAVEAADAERDRRGIAGHDGDIAHVAAELFGDDLREHRLGALAHGGGAASDMDAAVFGDAHADRLERTAAGPLDIIGEPHADVPALGARSLLARAELASSRRAPAPRPGRPDNRRCRAPPACRRAS